MLLYLLYLTLMLEKKLYILEYDQIFIYIHPSTNLSKSPLKRETVI